MPLEVRSGLELGPLGSAIGFGTVADFGAEDPRALAVPAERLPARPRYARAGRAVGGALGMLARRAVTFGTAALATLRSPATRATVQRGATHGARGTVSTARLTWGVAGWLVTRLVPIGHPLFANEAFRTFWLSRLAVQTSQGALLYGLLIVVADRTDATFFNALFVACSIVPSVVFGLPGGIVVDALPRRPLMVGLNLARFVLVFSLLIREPSLGSIFAATLGIWVIHQFYSPCESAVVAALVPPDRFVAAQALSNLALTLAQLLGLVLLAPVLLKFANPRILFAVIATGFAMAAMLAALLPRLDEHLDPVRRARANRVGLNRPPRSFRTAVTAMSNGWDVVRRDKRAFEALADDMMVGIGMTSLVVIMPIYLERVLGTAKENTVFVFAPAALGLVAGLRVAPLIGRSAGAGRVATVSLMGFALIIGSFGFVERLAWFLEARLYVPLAEVADLAGLSTLVLLSMLLSIPAGFASALVGVTTRSVLLNRTPPAARGQVIATQNLLGNLAALVPTLLTGAIADIVGVEPIAVAVAVVMLGGAFIAHTFYRQPATPDLALGPG
ncbi:MAG: MFS transporter [Chloroflexota bacterium]|nr:MFS transporter [Chloroflexota bacterium]